MTKTPKPDRQIDALVHDLHALTPAEIKIVEGSAK